MNILRRSTPTRVVAPKCWSLDAPLVSLSSATSDSLTLGDCLEHVAIFGGTGSGKTSGSGSTVAQTYLRAGFGGLVCCAKPDEAARWQAYAQATGRANSVIRFDASGRYRLNVLDYLLHLPPELGGGLVDNAVHTLMHLLQVAQGKNGGDSERTDFWLKAVRELLSNAIASLYHAYGTVRLDELLQLIHSVPTSEEQARDPDFQTWSTCYSTMRRLFDKPKIPLPEREAKLLVSYFGQTFGRLDPKTRSNIIITLSTELSPFLKGPLHTLFCTGTNITPEVTHDGVVLVMDLPLKRFEQAGYVAQMLVKYLWQKAAERRGPSGQARPIFLFADEAQFFVSPYDMEFLSTARSARAATVYITQNLPSLYASVGGTHPQDRIDALLGNFQTKIFHANSCHRTNQWAADLIGKSVQRRSNRSWSFGESSQTSDGHSGNWGMQRGTSRGDNRGSSVGGSYSAEGQHSISFNVSAGRQKGTSHSRSVGGGWSTGTSSGQSDTAGGGWSEVSDYTVMPSDFANGLRQGGPRNHFVVTGLLLQANRRFSRSGACWTPVKFKQP
ncbi:MAG: TraM recognition domain-containing protein [Rhizomicrobium sp.]